MDFKKEYIELLLATHTKEELVVLLIEAKQGAAAPRDFDWRAVDLPSPMLFERTYEGNHNADHEYVYREAVLSEPLKDYLKDLGFNVIND